MLMVNAVLTTTVIFSNCDMTKTFHFSMRSNQCSIISCKPYSCFLKSSCKPYLRTDKHIHVFRCISQEGISKTASSCLYHIKLQQTVQKSCFAVSYGLDYQGFMSLVSFWLLLFSYYFSSYDIIISFIDYLFIYLFFCVLSSKLIFHHGSHYIVKSIGRSVPSFQLYMGSSTNILVYY